MATHQAEVEVARRGAGLVQVRDVSLFTEVVGHGRPLVLMHGGPSLDHFTLSAFRRRADRLTVVFYDHRCNGRSAGAPVSSMTWENLTADADALREILGFERWAVLGHSFGGHVALEYALRFPDRLSHLILMDTAADCHWARENAAEVAAGRGFSPERAELVRRWFTGRFEPHEYVPLFMRIMGAYSYHSNMWPNVRDIIGGEWRMKLRPEAMIHAGRVLLDGWSVVDRLGEIQTPTLVMAGEGDFIFPPAAQRQLVAGIPHSRLHLVERAGHNPQSEQPQEVLDAVVEFVTADTP